MCWYKKINKIGFFLKGKFSPLVTAEQKEEKIFLLSLLVPWPFTWEVLINHFHLRCAELLSGCWEMMFGEWWEWNVQKFIKFPLAKERQYAQKDGNIRGSLVIWSNSLFPRGEESCSTTEHSVMERLDFKAWVRWVYLQLTSDGAYFTSGCLYMQKFFPTFCISLTIRCCR